MTLVRLPVAATLALAALGCGSAHATGAATLSSSLAQSVHSATSGGIGGKSIYITLLSGPPGEDCRPVAFASVTDPGTQTVGILSLDVDPATVAGKSFTFGVQSAGPTAELDLYPYGPTNSYLSVGGTVTFGADSTAEDLKGTIDADVAPFGAPPSSGGIGVTGTFDATPCGP